MKIKQDLLNGVQSPACHKCWTIERQGQDSRRIQENRFLDWKLNQNLQDLALACSQGSNNTLMYQIECSNLCNQACVTCNGQTSTKWQEIERRAGLKNVAEPRYLDIETLDINFSKAQRINFVGGEPAFDPRTFKVLERLLESGNNQCFISLVTNGSVLPNSIQQDLLRQFPNLNICFSIDGIGSRFEYMRWPGKWSILLEVMKTYQSITDNFSVSYTISAVNCLYYRETVDWFDQNSLRYNHNAVYSPEWAALAKMPLVIKEHLAGFNFFKDFVQPTGFEMSNQYLMQKLQAQDQMKKIRLQDYMPELYSLLAA